MNGINCAIRRFFRVAMNESGAARTAISMALLALMLAATGGNVFAANLTWLGDGGGNMWDIGTSSMWNDGSGASVYNDGDTVTLDDTGSASPNINLTATVSPASVAVTNTTKNYTIAGGGALAGTMTLTKSGTNTLTLCTANTFTGAVAVNAGTLDFAPPNSPAMNNVFSGTGTIRKSGANTLIIFAAAENANKFSGAVVVDGGTLQFNTSMGNRYRGLNYAASYTVNSGATLALAGQGELNRNGPMTLNGGRLTSVGNSILGPLTLNGGTMVADRGTGNLYRPFILNGHVTVGGNAPSYMTQSSSTSSGLNLAEKSAALTKTFTVADVTGDTNADLIVSASLYNSSQYLYPCGLIKAGAGTMVMSAANVYTETTTVNAGTLLVSGSLASPTVNVNNGGTLLVSGSSPLPSALVTVASNGTFGAAGTVVTSVTNLTFAEGAKVSWTYDGGARTAGLVHVTGTLTLPAAAVIHLDGTGTLHAGQALFSAETVEGATDLSGWSFENKPENTSVHAGLVGKQVVLIVSKGTMVRVW